ncbi:MULTISPECIES: BspA family leucine-rich repeat surface protein [Leuconostoc]|uniref:BspA family leucine-rich repeat surface protein n=1 Tax=Leuconostoc pseudomesenteroides TaxID=33968 RepID=A0A5B8SY25_LEUPS|nr:MULTISPECIES: BspA family leucine-rich repeat surface protein [Leuconostoc]MDG9733798.1 BspA family leucine-rich repeat surface protein [Leuconostoc pseudomesenteroides]MDN2450860.1 BspA family leucine-rich repeat surface protein [Leuconostoc sp. UCMA20149]NKZ36298.1 BspA family leucine-rich repeat surface protein [Leuconostoc pseudomesenteroides]QEA41556.1 BspA family leucine-rich repeat surface protein [Leuconostoc pseudomesenteroides]QQB27591.1 BspA family leucine-rich repeat surface pro
MRLNKQFYLPILITLLTFTGPIQSVTAAEVMTADDVKTDKKLRLPNDGRSDLQELIQRVATDDTGDGQSAGAESDELETPEVAEPEQPKVEADPQVEQPLAKTDSKPASSGKAPRTITENLNGTSTWTFDSDTGLLVFEQGRLSQNIYSNIEAAELYRNDVKKIKFEGTVTVDPNVPYLFANLGQLTEFIDLQNFDTSNVTSMSYWFYNSKGLTNPDLSALNTSNVTNMSNMFYGTLATSLDLSAWNVDKVTTFAYMFSGATALTTLNLSSWGAHRTADVVSMAHMFYNTAALQNDNFNLTDFNTTNVNNMTYMFQSTGLTNLDLSMWDITKVADFSYMFNGSKIVNLDLSHWGENRTAENVNMADMFYNTQFLENLVLTDFKTNHVTNMAYMFGYTKKMTVLDLSQWDVSEVTNFSYMFASSSLVTLNVSNWCKNGTAENINMSHMFQWMVGLENLIQSDFTTDRVTDMSYMFQSFSKEYLDLSSWNVSKVTTFVGMFNGTEAKTIDLSGWGVNRTAENVTMEDMFRSTNVEGLTLNNFDTINVTDMTRMFESINLNALDLSHFNVDQVTEFQFMFNKSKLEVINLSSWGSNREIDGVNMRSMFAYTEDLKQLILTNFMTTGVATMMDMFSYSGIGELDLSWWDVSQVANFMNMFNFSQLKTLDVSHWNVGENVASVGMTSMFANMSQLNQLTLTGFKTTNVTAMTSMFNKNGASQLDVSDWDVSKVTYMSNMFYDSRVTTLDLSKWNTSSLTGRTNMFTQMTKLWKVKLGPNVQLGTGNETTMTFTAAPSIGTTLNDNGHNYITTAASWQVVGSGTDHNPKGDIVTTSDMWQNELQSATYVWTQAPFVNSVSSFGFGQVKASDFRGSKVPTAVGASSCSFNLSNLEVNQPYQITIEQTSDWTNHETSKKISDSDLSMYYGDDDMSNGPVIFWQEEAQNSQVNIPFDHDNEKRFNLQMNKNITMNSSLIGKLLESTVTWSFNDTP